MTRVSVARATAHVLAKQGLAGARPPSVPDAVEAKVAGIAAAIGIDLRPDRAPAPGPLPAGPRNAFLSPISLGGSSVGTS
jgi:hypothetical protein